MDNIVKLVFQAIATGSGFGKLLGEVKGLNEKMPGLSKAAQIVGMSFGTAGAAAGRMVSMLLQGSIWGVAAEGAKLLIDKLGLFKDKTAETKEKLDKLEESTRKFYETINSNSQKSLEKIDTETKKRNEQLEITNRMIKAELQLQRARAVASGDAKGVESIDRQLTKAGNDNAMQKARLALNASDAKVKAAEKSVRELENAARGAERQSLQARKDLFESHWQDYRSRYKSVGGIASRKDFEKGFRFSEDDNKILSTYEKTAKLANEEVDAAYDRLNAEREKWKVAHANVKALELEQKAAAEKAMAEKMSAEMKALKEKAAADEKAWKDEQQRIREQEEQDEKEFQRKKREETIKRIKEEARRENEERKKSLQADIESNRKRAGDLEARLADATARANAAHDVLGNAANMDQGGDLADNRRERMNNSRFANGAIDLIGSGKIRRGANGEWMANGRLSNMNQAILERLNAEQNKRNVEKDQDKVVRKLDELIRKFEELTSL